MLKIVQQSCKNCATIV